MTLDSAERAMLEGVAGRADSIIARAVGWCAGNSGSRNLEGLERQRALLADAFSTLPGEIAFVPLEPSGEIDAAGRPQAQAHTDALMLTVREQAPVQVVLTGHYDTVYPADTSFREVRRRDDGALHGPGVADMKGGISVMLAALEAFETHAAASAVGYRVLLSPDEEIGSPASAPLLAELGRTAHVGLTYEPALADGALASSRKGSGNFSVAVRGRAAHAGRDFAAGRNAITTAARLAAALDDLNRQREGVTVNVARIDGGGPLNMVPDAAVVRFNVRVPDAESSWWIEERIAEALRGAASDGLALERHGGFTRAPKPVNGAQEQLFAAVREAAAAINVDLSWRPSGGVCEGNNLFAAGLPNLDTLGVRGGDIHSENEHAWPESFAERAQLSALVMARLATGAVDARAIRAAMGGR
ncbi:MAG TPA: hydrolase [Caulobacteraceae bacterium]|jgi:glutamate carboxypeptidase